MDLPATPPRAGSRAVLIVAGAVAAVMWLIALWFRLARPGPSALDRRWDAFAGAAPGSPLHAVAQVFATVGTGLPAVLVTAVVAVLLGLLRGWGWSLFTIAASLLSELDVLGLKTLAMRARPDSAYGIGTSFPSGHTANAALLGVVVILLVRHLAVRIPVAVYIVAMAWSRTVLHAHWLTDVLGGLAIGTVTAILLHALWRATGLRREARRHVGAEHLSATG
jgi:membrane-associated phospholipid phosphatase